MGRGDLSRAEFERVVSEALESLPKRFADMVENVVISVEEEPSAEDLNSIGDDDDSELLGIYRGVSLTRLDRASNPVGCGTGTSRVA